MFNDQLDIKSPNHLRNDPMVAAWIADHQSDHREKDPDCRDCGWPHASVLMCGMGSKFGRVRLGRRYFYVDTSNVAYMRSFVNGLSVHGFHWRDETYFKRVGDVVVVTYIEDFNGHPQLKQWQIPINEFASIVCAASVGGETGERYREAQNFLLGSPQPPTSETPQFWCVKCEQPIWTVEGTHGHTAYGHVVCAWPSPLAIGRSLGSPQPPSEAQAELDEVRGLLSCMATQTAVQNLKTVLQDRETAYADLMAARKERDAARAELGRLST